MKKKGYKIVLSSDRTLVSEYQGGIFLGFSACFPTSLVNERFYFRFFCPSTGVGEDGSLKFAPRGLRIIQSKLIDDGFSEEDIIVAHPDYLDKVVGEETEILGLSEQDPLGQGPATSTFTDLFGGEAYMSKKFREIFDTSSIKENNPHVVVGGPGSWQLISGDEVKKSEVDTVFLGESEEVVSNVFEKIINNKTVPEIIKGNPTDLSQIPESVGPTLNGLVEISRGCGNGCSFCPLSDVERRDFSLDKIISDIKTNLRAGEKTPILHAEDVLKYKSNNGVNKEAVLDLFNRIKELPEVRFVDISHFSISSILEAPDLIKEISKILDLGNKQLFLGGQVGVETGSPRLIKKHMGGKTYQNNAEEWQNNVVEAFRILSDNYWVPAATILMGIPGEQNEDVRRNIELVERLNGYRSLIVPLSYVYLDRKDSFKVSEASEEYKELFKKCWQHNFKWMDSLYRDYSKMYLSGVKSIPIRLVLKFAKYYYGKRLEKMLNLK